MIGGAENSVGADGNTSKAIDTVNRELYGYSKRVTDIVHRELGIRHDRTRITERGIVLVACLTMQELQLRDSVASHFGRDDEAIPWEMQLKYRLDDNTTVGHECYVQLGSLCVPYGFNYHHPSSSVVVTRSSLRYLFTLSACIRNAQGCFLTGPAESGKSTLTNQVGSILGRKEFATTVSSTTQYAHLARLLAGALVSGGTFCAMFGRLTAPATTILKTLVTTITSIERSVLSGAHIDALHRSPIPFVAGTALMITCSNQPTASSYSTADVKRWTEGLCQFSIVPMDDEMVFESLLAANEFDKPRELTKQLSLLRHRVRGTRRSVYTFESHQLNHVFSIRVMKEAIKSVSENMWRYTEELERDKLQRYLLKKALVRYCQDWVIEFESATTPNPIEAAFQNEDHKDQWFVKQYEREQKERKRVGADSLKQCLVAACDSALLTPRRHLIESATVLASQLQSGTGVVLVGGCGTGKTTTYQVLAKALSIGRALQSPDQKDANSSDARRRSTLVNRRQSAAMAPKRRSVQIGGAIPSDESDGVVLRVVLPHALTMTQLYGCVFTDRKDVASSVLGRIIHDAQVLLSASNQLALSDTSTSQHASPSMESCFPRHRQLWTVFDGQIDSNWMENLTSILRTRDSVPTEHGASNLLSFDNGEFMTIPPNVRFIFESLNLRHASPSTVASNAIIHFGAADKPSDRDEDSDEPIFKELLRRHFALQHRLLAEMNDENKAHNNISHAYALLKQRLLNTDLLEKLAALIEEYSPIVNLTILQRTRNLVELLQAQLSMVVASFPNTALIVSPPCDDDASDQFGEALSVRVGMVLVYSLLWGFCACINDELQLQPLVSNMIKSAVPEAAPAWTGRGRDVNLYEMVADFANSRFVPISDALVEWVALRTRDLAADSPHDGARNNAPTNVPEGGKPSNLFVPTRSSLLTHIAMKETIRTGRSVLMIGSEMSRKTTLVRNFMHQLAGIRGLSSFLNSTTSTKTGGSTSTPPSNVTTAPPATKDERTLETVNRIRFHQVMMVTRLARRFRYDTTHRKSDASKTISPAPFTKPVDGSTEMATQEVPLIKPTLMTSMIDSVTRFDKNSVIPFFFAMSQHHDGALDLASCMERMLQRERKQVFEPPPGKAAILIIDDLHLALDCTRGRSDDLHVASVHAFLRSACEHSAVCTGAIGSAIKVENLLTIASTSICSTGSSCDGSEYQPDESFRKFVHQCFPVLAPRCSSSESCSIFYTSILHQFEGASSAVCRLPVSVKQDLPAIVAATVVLWEFLCSVKPQSPSIATSTGVLTAWTFNMHDLARVHDAIATVEPLLIEDSDTLVRLWSHECIRTFQDRFVGASDERSDRIISEIARMKDLLIHVKQDSAHKLAAKTGQIGESLQETRMTPALSGYSPASAYLPLLRAAFTPPPMSKSPRKQSEVPIPPSLADNRTSNPRFPGLWAFIPESIYLDSGNGAETQNRSKSPSQVRKSSRMLLRRSSASMSFSGGKPVSASANWIYAEIFDEASSDESVEENVRKYFSWVIASPSISARSERLTTHRWSISSPDPSSPSLPLSLVLSFRRHSMKREPIANIFADNHHA